MQKPYTVQISHCCMYVPVRVHIRLGAKPFNAATSSFFLDADSAVYLQCRSNELHCYGKEFPGKRRVSYGYSKEDMNGV